MSKLAAANRRARHQMRDLYFAGNDVALMALMNTVVAAAKSKRRNERIYAWPASEQFARLQFWYPIPIPANEEVFHDRT